MAEQGLFDLDLDALVGGEVRVKHRGEVLTFYADFSSADQHQFLKIQDRLARSARLGVARRLAELEHSAAATTAEQAGLPEPVPLDLEQFGPSHPDFYGQLDFERDVFALLVRIWQASEASKPEAERVGVTEDSARATFHLDRAWQVLLRLWLSRNEPRVSAPAPEQPVEPAPLIPSKVSGKRPRRSAA